MTIVPHKQAVQGSMLTGHQISCHLCHGSNFMHDMKHLPIDIIKNKFRDRGWEVNSNQKDLCPSCIDGRRNKQFRNPKSKPESGSLRVLPVSQHEPLNADSVKRVIFSKTTLKTEVVEIKHQHRKFRIEIVSQPEIPLGMISSAQGELLYIFEAKFVGSYFKVVTETEPVKNGVAVNHHLYWFLTMEQQQQMRAAE